jgi:hypothetical protein
MNTFTKYCPNVYVAKSGITYTKGDIIEVITQYGKVVECVVHNLVLQKQGIMYYSVVRADGMNAQEWAKKKADRLLNASSNASNKGNAYWQASHEGRDFLALAEPIKVGHHSEKRHRALIERNHNRMHKSVELADKATEYAQRAKYWETKAKDINLSMPESLEYYEFEVEKAKARHEGFKSGAIPKEHSYSLTYAKKDLNEAIKKLETAKILWA